MDYEAKIYTVVCPRCDLELLVRGAVDAAGVVSGHKHIGVLAVPTTSKNRRRAANVPDR